MNTYISILRGINVSGKKNISMGPLRKMYEETGFKNVISYVQSGNIIFNDSTGLPSDLGKIISDRILVKFRIEVPVIVMTIETLKDIVENNPFISDPSKDPGFFHITFLADTPAAIDLEEIAAKKSAGEEAVVMGNTVYLYCPNGYGRTKLNNNFLENRLKVSATTRNWKTTNELLRIAQEKHGRL